MYVDDVAPLIVALHPELEYHWYVEYIPEPPDGAAVSVTVWPESIVAGVTETKSTGFTVTVTVVVVVPLRESATLTQ